VSSYSTSSFNMPQVEKLTRTDIFTRFLRETGLGMTGTASAGAVDSVTDNIRLQSAQYSQDDWTGAFVRVAKKASSVGSSPEGLVRVIPIGGYTPGNGKMAFSPAMAANISAGDTYQLWRFPHPQDVIDTLDEILVNECYIPSWTLLSEVPDGDMEQPNTTDWAAVNATITKTSAEPAMSGSRWLSVLTTAGGGYAQTATLNVQPNKGYYVSCGVLNGASGTSATITAWDVTNGAQIAQITTARTHNVRPWLQFNTPATCDRMVIRLGNTSNGATTLFDELVFFGTQQYDIALPWWVRNPQQVKGVFVQRQEWIEDNVMANVLRGEEDTRWDIQDIRQGRSQLRLVARIGYISQPLFIYGSRNETAFSDDNVDVKHIDGNWIQAALAYKIFSQLSAYPGQGSLDNTWINQQLVRWQQEYELRKTEQTERLSQVRQSTSPDGYFMRQASYNEGGYTRGNY